MARNGKACTCDLELMPGVSMADLGTGERLVLSALRLMTSGGTSCGAIRRVFQDMLPGNAAPALDGLQTLASLLPHESNRTLTLGRPCTRGITWDEAAFLGLLEAAQRSDTPAISRWLEKLDIDQPSTLMQRGLAWLSASFGVSACPLQRETASLTASRVGAQRSGVTQ